MDYYMSLYYYLTIIRRRRSEYWWIFPETKSRGIFTNIHEPEANNCFSIITQVIIEIPKQRNVKFYLNLPLRVRTTRFCSQINWTWTWTWMCHAMPFWTRALKKKHFLWHSYCVKTNQNVVYRGLYSYRQWVRFITLFPINFLVLLVHVERLCKSFWKKSLTRTSSSFA